MIASGLIWPDAQDILVQKAFLMHQPFGQGHVIAFAEEPNYRAFTESTMLLFMNAVCSGPVTDTDVTTETQRHGVTFGEIDDHASR